MQALLTAHRSLSIMSYLALLVLIFIVEISENAVNSECDIFYMENQPLKCCHYPIAWWPEGQENICNQRCNDKSTRFCCVRKCWDDIFEVHEDGKLEPTKIVSAFEPAFKTKIHLHQDDWKFVIEQSIETCQKIAGSLFQVYGVCGETKFHYEAIFRCIYRNNFLNTPPINFNSSTECEALKTLVKTTDKCGDKFGDTFLLKIQMWIRS